MSKSAIEATLAAQIAEAGLPAPEREFVFAPPRRWRADFAWLEWDYRLIVECEGGTWKKDGNRHGYGLGFEGDCIKYNEAELLGYHVLRVTGRMVDDGRALAYIRRALGEGE